MEALLSLWQVFLLGMGRVSAMIALVPILGGRTMPMPIKILVTLILTIFCLKHTTWTAPVAQLSTDLFWVLMIKEMIIGFLIGLSITIVMAAIQAAGEFMGFQMMFTAASTFMAFTQERSTVISNMFYIIAALVFASIDGHHWLIKALHHSFEVVPVLALPGSFGGLGFWIELFASIFTIGLRLALPLMGTLLITNLMLGMIARTMPQLNVFVVGLPIQIATGLVLLSLMSSSLVIAEIDIFRNWVSDLMLLINRMRP